MEPRLEKFTLPVDENNKQLRHIAYTDWGLVENENVLFCIHGLTRNSRDFDYIAKRLSKHYRVICPDIAGRGRSSWLIDKNKYFYDTYIEDMKLLLQHLGLRQIDWIGTSMGGYIGIFLEALNPGTIKKIVLNDIGPYIPTNSLKRISKYVGMNPVLRDHHHAVEHLRIILAPFNIKKEEQLHYLASHSVMEHSDGTLRLAYDPAISERFGSPEEIESIGNFDVWEYFDKVKSEVMVVRGQKSDILLRETVDEMQERLNMTAFHEVVDAGHAPSLMEDSQIDAIEEWLVGMHKKPLPPSM